MEAWACSACYLKAARAAACEVRGNLDEVSEFHAGSCPTTTGKVELETVAGGGEEGADTHGKNTNLTWG